MNFDPERLHVIRCYERLPPLSGGMERHIAQLTAAQRDLGVRVTEVFNRGTPEGESVQVWRGASIDQIRPYLLRSALFYAAAARRRFPLHDDRNRVVHVHGDWPAFLFGSIFGRLIGARVVAASLHEWMRGSPHHYALSLRHCDPIFATGLQEARRLSAITCKSVTHIPSAPSDVFFTKPRRRADPSDLIVVGSLIGRKNIELVLAIAERRPGWSISIYGGGPDYDNLERMRRQKGLNNVRFHGSVGQETLHAAMSASSLYLNTALAEGSPTAALEAMASGLPVVLTPSNDYSDLVVEGVNGVVSANWNIDELVATIERFLNEPARLVRARTAARETAKQHNWPEKARVVTEAMLMACVRHPEAH